MIIDLAFGRGLTVIAEGVEHEEHRSKLLSRGVTLAQGWLFGKPMSRLDFVSAHAVGIDTAPAFERKLARVA